MHLAAASNPQPAITAPPTAHAKSEGIAKSVRGPASPAVSGDPSSSAVTYQGGPIQVEQNVYLIFWLPSGLHFEPAGNDSNYEALITRYFDDVGGSQFYGILGQYPDTMDGAPTTTVHVAGVFVDSSPYPESGTQANPILGSDIVNEVEKYLGSGTFPIGIDDAFFVFTASGIDSCQSSADTICSFPTLQSSGYCAYHSYFEYNGYSVTYADMGDDPGTAGCEISLSSIGSSTYPNGDGLADSEINLASQEQFDIASDPLLSSWYASSSSTGEISDLCAGNYGTVNPTTGSNIVLNKDNYIVQEEWSNSAGACTLSAPVTTAVSVTMNVATGGDALSAYNYFQMTFDIGKQLFVADYTGQTMQFNADPGTTLTFSATSSASDTEKWCLEYSCQTYSVNLGTGTQAITLGYYDLLPQTAIEYTSTPAPSSFDTLSYSTAPQSAGSSTSPAAATITLSLSPQTIMVLRGSTVTVPQQTQSGTSAQERWYTAAESTTVTQPDQLAPVLVFQQYMMTFDYQIVGSSTGSTPPSVLYFAEDEPLMTNGGTSEWTDAGTTYYYPVSLGTSSATERWAITPGTGSGTVTTAETIEITYYQQFNVSVGFTVAGATGDTPSVSFSAQLFGAPISFTVNSQSPTSSWVDAGSTYLLPNPLTGSTSSERWYAATGTSGTISSTTLVISPTYYHQYSISFSYGVKTIPGGNLTLPSQPSLLFSNLSSTSTLKLSTTSSAVWVNAGSNYSLSSTIAGTSGTERWASSGTSDVATEPGSTTLLLYDQYEVHFLVVMTGSGFPGPALLNATAFGQEVSVIMGNATAQTVWIDAGSNYSLTNPLNSTSATERWIASAANVTGIISSARSVSVHYYQQYLETLSYSIMNGGSPGGGPTVSFTSLGVAGKAAASTNGTEAWADAGTQYSFASTLPGSSSSEQWAANNATASGVFSSSTTVSVAYDHQYYVTAITNTPAAQLPASASGWYEPGASVILTAPTASGWKFEGWAGTSSGNTTSLLLTVVSPVTETATYYAALTLTAQGSASIHYSFGNVTGTVAGGHTETIYVPPSDNVKLQGGATLLIYKFSGWTGNASALPPPTNKTKLDTVNPFELSIRAPSSVVAESSVNYISVGILAAIIVVGCAAAFLFFRKQPPPSEFQEARTVQNQPITRSSAKT